MTERIFHQKGLVCVREATGMAVPCWSTKRLTPWKRCDTSHTMRQLDFPLVCNVLHSIFVSTYISIRWRIGRGCAPFFGVRASRLAQAAVLFCR